MQLSQIDRAAIYLRAAMKMKLPKLVGVTGTNGAGKDTVAKFLENHNFKHISLSDILRDIADEKNLKHTRENLRQISQEIRQSEGDGAIMKLALVDCTGRRLCITSIRTPGEAEELKRAGGVVVWVNADPEVRHQRIMSGVRGRDETDEVTFEEFLRQEKVEMTPTNEGGGLNIGAVKGMADIKIENNFDTIEEFMTYLDDQFEF